MLEVRQERPTTAQRFPPTSLAGSRFIDSPYLSSNERHALASAVSATRSIDACVELLRERENTDQVHILIEGWACRYKTTREGARQIVALLIPGDAANLDSFAFDRLDYGIRTFTTTRVATISRDHLLALAERYVQIAKTLAWLAMVENAILSQWTLRLGRQSASQRLAHLFCEMSTRLGAQEGDSFECPLTQEQIADTLGITAVHVNRTLQQLRNQGLVQMQKGEAAIFDMDALRRLGEFDSAYLHTQSQQLEAAKAGWTADASQSVLNAAGLTL